MVMAEEKQVIKALHKLTELHNKKAAQWLLVEDKGFESEKSEDLFHADLTYDFTRKFTLWMAWMSQQNDIDINLKSIDDYISHFAEKVYKPE